MSSRDDQRHAQLRNLVFQSINRPHKTIQTQFKDIRWLAHSNGKIEVRRRSDYADYTMT
jgi:hypothetical protein